MSFSSVHLPFVGLPLGISARYLGMYLGTVQWNDDVRPSRIGYLLVEVADNPPHSKRSGPKRILGLPQFGDCPPTY
jgi:hypothetical protein